MTEFKDRLIAARERAELTQLALGEISDIAGTQISRYEAGRAVPRRPVIQRLARALGVSYEWLARGKGADQQFMVMLAPRADGSMLHLTADADTQEKFFRLAALEGLTPEQFLSELVLERLKKLQAGLAPVKDEEDAWAELKRRIEALESKVGDAPAVSGSKRRIPRKHIEE